MVGIAHPTFCTGWKPVPLYPYGGWGRGFGRGGRGRRPLVPSPKSFLSSSPLYIWCAVRTLHRLESLCHQNYSIPSFPSSCLGMLFLAQALLGHLIILIKFASILRALQSRALPIYWVPKQELGNQKRMYGGRCAPYIGHRLESLCHRGLFCLLTTDH